MYDGKTFRCDAEIGSPKGGWRSCGRLAVVQVSRPGKPCLEMCEKHEKTVAGEARPLSQTFKCKTCKDTGRVGRFFQHACAFCKAA